MDEEKRFYAVVVVVQASGTEEARKVALEGRVVGRPWPVKMGGHDEDAIRLIDQHPEADF